MRLGAVLLSLLLAGCGYAAAGTWDDDPANWGRVFGGDKPDSVVVVHSHYWRSPHFTMEFEYFFEIAKDDEFQARFFRMNELVRLEGAKAEPRHFGEKPAWFLPKPLGSYEVWTFAERPQNFRLFIDRETGEIFLTDYQV